MIMDRETTSVGDYERHFGIAEGSESRGSEAPCEARHPVIGWLAAFLGTGLGLVLISI
jgi:hypothetical protein